jgi:AraC-like DNA-binding protein
MNTCPGGIFSDTVASVPELNESHYAERPPTPELADYVASLWYQRVSAGSGRYGQRIVPDGSVDALWRDGLLCVAGPDTSWRMEEVPAGSSIVGIRLRPGAARLLFGEVPASETRNQQIDLSDLWGAGPVRELGERMGAAGSHWAMAEVLEQAMLGRLRDANEVDAIIRASIRAFDAPEPMPVPAVAERFGLSERQFRRRFVTAVGYGPKALEGVFRLRRAMNLYETHAAGGCPARATEVAVAVGYADQAHMTREMRRLAGITPSQLIRSLPAAAPATRALPESGRVCYAA